MYSQYWSTAHRRQPDYRRYTVVEGDTPLPLGSTGCRKRLRSAGEESDGEARRRSCGSRPNPEKLLSANELSRYGEWDEEEQEEEGVELQRLCQRCHIMASQLNRQAAALADTAALKDPAYASFLFNKLQRLQLPHRGRHTSVNAHCDVCAASFQQLRHCALRRALGLSREMTPCPAAPSVFAASSTATTAESGWAGDELPPKQQRWTYEGREQQQQQQQQWGSGALWGWGGVQSTYLGGGGAKGLATVTPLPLNAQNYLEGVWRVDCCSPKLQHCTGLASDSRGHVTTKTCDVPVKPAAHTIATQTSPAPSAAVAFFIRAAQKLSLSRRKKSQTGPTSCPASSPPTEAPGPLLYTGGFRGALQLSPPAVPPCLLRTGSKVKDTPGVGKVRVMVRICSVHNSESSESMCFLKVDGRKKQLTLCETSAGGRSSASAPKTFTFDGIFSQDTSQAEMCSGTLADIIQSVVNGADGCIFCYGHANLGKTYTMIGRDCSTQSLGVAPTAISWLFKVIEDRKEKSGARFSVRVSAVEISGREETLTDLLADPAPSAGCQQEVPGPTVSLREDPICGSQLQNQTELQATSVELAARFLDAALAARRSSRMPSDQEARRNSHFLFTLHIYQERQDRSNKAAVSGRSRLHLLDLGSCETDISRTREGGGAQCLSLSALGNVILALANGAKHVPYRDSKLTMLLSESLGNINCRSTMIAHISDSPLSYMETLTTVQLAARIHRTRKKKSKHTSSSSGGESSCEEGPPYRPPHLQSFHPRTVALDPDTPLLLSSDPDYSSSSEHSCDTVIYIGPGGNAISDRELSDNEGPPSFVPIIPSLNKKRAKDAPRSNGDHLKCNTFAELQERLDCIDGSEGLASIGAEGKAALWTKPTEVAPPPKSDKNSSHWFSESTRAICTNKCHQEESPVPPAAGLVDTSRRTGADGEKLSCVVKPVGTSSQDSEPAVREKVYLRGGGARPSASPSTPRTSRSASQPGDGLSRTPPVGMSQQAPGSPSMETAALTSRYPFEVRNLRATLLERDFLRTTVTLQQPMELNGEDELVFTVIEELPLGLIPDNGRPSNLLSFDTTGSSQSSGARPVSIISSINDEYDAYTAQAAEAGTDAGTDCQKMLERSCVGSWRSESSTDLADAEGTHSTGSFYSAMENASMLTSPNLFKQLPCLQYSLKSSLNDSSICFSELDSDPATPNKHHFTKFPPSPDPTKALLKSSFKTLNPSVSLQASHHSAHSSLPRKTKPTSPAAASCSKQEGRHGDFLLQGNSCFDPREVEFLSASKPLRSGSPTVCSKRSGGNSQSVPRPPKPQMSSSAQRVVDGCERLSSRRGDTLIKLPRLTRGATTLGTVSTPQHLESKWSHEAATVAGSLRFSSLGKKSNGQKSNIISKSGPRHISPPAPIELKTRTVLSSSALKTSSNVENSLSPKMSASEEEFSVRLRADSFSQRTSTLKTEQGSARTSSSLKTRGPKADSSRYYGSLMSLERCDSPTLSGSKPGAFSENSGATGGNCKSSRSVQRLGLPAFISTPASSPQVSPTVFGNTGKLGPVRSSSCSRTGAAAGLKVRTLSTSSSKSMSSSSKPPDNAAGRNSSLSPTSRSPARSGTGAKAGRGTIMGTKQAISRAPNSRVSELAAGSPRKQLSRGLGVTGSDTNVGGNPSRSALTMPLPSPYSKITAPRRPQRYSSGHGSDNSSILSGELPPAMGRTALFYHSGGSSGYESMIRDSETTGSTSSAHDSMSESGTSSSNRSRVSKSPKKRGNGFLRRRLIPAPLPDTIKVGGQWVDLPPPLGGALKEAFEIKVYEIDDVEHRQKRRAEAVMTAAGSESTSHDVEKGLLYFDGRLRMLEKRQQLAAELRSKHERLKDELEEVKGRLMLDPSRWSGDFDVDQDLDRESQEYLEALAQVTAELEDCVNLCKSRIMMETCFDIAVMTAATAVQGGRQEVEV